MNGVSDEQQGLNHADMMACATDDRSPRESAERAGVGMVVPVELVDESTFVVRWCRALAIAWESVFGAISLVVGLALIATIPIVQLISLGYLLEMSGRVARSGRIRDGWIGLRQGARVGGWVLGTWLSLVPWRVVSNMAEAAQLIDPGGVIAARWEVGQAIILGLTVLHLSTAWFCGGRLRHFLWPLIAPVSLAVWAFRRGMGRWILARLPEQGRSWWQRLVADLWRTLPLRTWFVPAIVWDAARNGTFLIQSRDGLWRFVTSLRLPYYFWLGLRGFCGTFLWLVVPVSLFAGATVIPPPGGVFSGLVGAVLLMIVIAHLPFLQAHFAAEQRLSALFAWSEVRRRFRHAPLAFCFAVLVTLAFALPLYLLMVEQTPREVTFLPAGVFVVFAMPARLINGWALSRARRADRPRHFLFRWLARFALVPVCGAFVFILFFTRYTSWSGIWSLYEQHAFLIPAPWWGTPFFG